MTNKTDNGMTMSSETQDMFLAAQARIAAIPAGSTLIDSISDEDWIDVDDVDWVINAGTDEIGCSEELDESDKETVQVA